MNEKSQNKELLFFNEAIEYIEKISEHDNISNKFLNENNNTNHFLRDAMLNELENLKSLIKSNPDFKLETLSTKERQIFQNFIDYYSICPICRGFNHYFNLKQLFFDEKKRNLIEDLIKFMNLKNRKFKNLNINFGIPCCECYKKLVKDSK